MADYPQATPEEIAAARRFCGADIFISDNALINRGSGSEDDWLQVWVSIPSDREDEDEDES